MVGAWRLRLPAVLWANWLYNEKWLLWDLFAYRVECSERVHSTQQQRQIVNDHRKTVIFIVFISIHEKFTLAFFLILSNNYLEVTWLSSSPSHRINRLAAKRAALRNELFAKRMSTNTICLCHGLMMMTTIKIMMIRHQLGDEMIYSLCLNFLCGKSFHCLIKNPAYFGDHPSSSIPFDIHRCVEPSPPPPPQPHRDHAH